MRDARHISLRRGVRTALALACAALLAPAPEAAAQSGDQGGLSFRQCWTVCGPSAEGRNEGACERCLSDVCSAQPSLSSHPACRRVGASAQPAASQSTTPEPARETSTPPRVSNSSNASARTNGAPANCDVPACSARWRSFRASDCTYQPYEGPRQVCTETSAPDAAATEIVASEPTPAPTPPANCDVPACTARWRTFRVSDCTYQPYEGPRQVCTETSAPADAELASATAAADDSFVCNYEVCEEAYLSFRRSDCTYQPYEGPRRRCERGQSLVSADAVAANENEATTITAADQQDQPADEIDRAFSEAELAETEIPEIDEEIVKLAQAELDAEETFDAVATMAAPVGYTLFALFVLAKLALMRPIEAAAIAPHAAASHPAEPAEPERPKADRWRVSSAAFGGRPTDWPDDFSRG